MLKIKEKLQNLSPKCRVTRRPALCGTVPHWKVLSRNKQALDAGRIDPAFQRYFKLLTNNQNNYSKEKSIFEYFLELVVSDIKDPDDSLCILSIRVLLNLNSGSDRGYCEECIDIGHFSCTQKTWPLEGLKVAIELKMNLMTHSCVIHHSIPFVE